MKTLAPTAAQARVVRMLRALSNPARFRIVEVLAERKDCTLPCIAEVNAEKFGSFTPGTGIPIVSEAEARAMAPDYFLVLPWHFKEGILQREREYLTGGGKMIFPFPEIEIV